MQLTGHNLIIAQLLRILTNPDNVADQSTEVAACTANFRQALIDAGNEPEDVDATLDEALKPTPPAPLDPDAPLDPEA